jgi:hypothetical protein
MYVSIVGAGRRVTSMSERTEPKAANKPALAPNHGTAARPPRGAASPEGIG